MVFLGPMKGKNPFNPNDETLFCLTFDVLLFLLFLLLFMCISAFVWLNSEPCGVFCGLMSWAFLAYGMGATTVTRNSYQNNASLPFF